LNDNTTQGLECEDLNCFSVQYHPEASPGPHDAAHHFDRFLEMMIQNKATAK
jgi:carbamoyl-phosphate synthase small subunit